MLFSLNSALCEKIIPGAKERGQINFPNYASQLQAIIARSKGAKILKQLDQAGEAGQTVRARVFSILLGFVDFKEQKAQ